MITLKSQREIEAMDRAGDFLASIHIGLRDVIKPGVDMWAVEEYVRKRCKEGNVLPLQIGVEGHLMDYPYATCCGLNDEVAHAFPRHYILKEGDLLKVDMVLSEPLDKSFVDVSTSDFNNVEMMKEFTENYKGGLADSCWAYAVGQVSQEVKDLMDVTKECLYIGIEKAVVGNRIGDIGAAIQEYAESRGYGVVRDLVGHGVGPTMHEEPMVPHYGRAGRGLRLKEGMVLTIEPMINTGTWEIDTDMETGWAHKTLDGGLSCQYEHQFVITKDGPVILTSQGEEGTY
ncbi:methionyl aminopeptidase [Streptococcus sp. X16XC17]|uniref:methionyl aminopeptidase n=1 Tax=Streptococcus sp. X16XC17 TaxID=2316646 RepID=UPI00104021CD|nr:methionyl aminopeptidase [Streptococcus sp. X16XC17]TCD46155.1 methionyl aminopeptidase [Streptococcus sp. X16XC17]